MQKFRIHSAAALALVLLAFILGAEKAECMQSSGDGAPAWKATRVGDCLPDGEEFLMGSETSRMILQSGKENKTITYPATNSTKPFCDKRTYGSCIGEGSKNYNDRPCNYDNTCNRNVTISVSV